MLAIPRLLSVVLLLVIRVLSLCLLARMPPAARANCTPTLLVVVGVRHLSAILLPAASWMVGPVSKVVACCTRSQWLPLAVRWVVVLGRRGGMLVYKGVWVPLLKAGAAWRAIGGVVYWRRLGRVLICLAGREWVLPVPPNVAILQRRLGRTVLLMGVAGLVGMAGMVAMWVCIWRV
jgi:hypothetical protein